MTLGTIKLCHYVVCRVLFIIVQSRGAVYISVFMTD
jgi:hypothetical protein